MPDDIVFWGFGIIVISSSIWVLVDAKTIGVEKGQISGVADLGPWGWFISCLLLWIVAFPLYLAKRGDLQRMNSVKTHTVGRRRASLSLYEILGVERTATTAEINRAALTLGERFRPDRNADNENAARRFEAIERAYAVLRDPALRANYDMNLSDDEQAVVSPSVIPVLGIASLGLGVASILSPYVAAIFFAPGAIVLAAVAAMKEQKPAAVIGGALGLVGIVGIALTSSQLREISTAFGGSSNIGAGRQGSQSLPPVVTLNKYRRIQSGMSYQQVRSIVGMDGQRISRTNVAGSTGVAYLWSNLDGSGMSAIFLDNRLVNKSQNALR